MALPILQCFPANCPRWRDGARSYADLPLWVPELSISFCWHLPRESRLNRAIVGKDYLYGGKSAIKRASTFCGSPDVFWLRNPVRQSRCVGKTFIKAFVSTVLGARWYNDSCSYEIGPAITNDTLGFTEFLNRLNAGTGLCKYYLAFGKFFVQGCYPGDYERQRFGGFFESVMNGIAAPQHLFPEEVAKYFGVPVTPKL
jgi:hypothetical protein